MTHDECVMAAVIGAFATLLTTHVTLIVGLARRIPRWRALVAAVVLPLAPIWGSRVRMRARSAMWVFSAAAYGVARWLARR